MIQPAPRAVIAMAAGAPLALVMAAFVPGLWFVAAGWILAVLAAGLVDWALAAPARGLMPSFDAPDDIAAAGSGGAAVLRLGFAGRAPARIEATLGTDARIVTRPARAHAAVEESEARLGFKLVPVRRGEARVERAWTRWRGPLGLIERQRSFALDRVVRITPDVRTLAETAAGVAVRDFTLGEKRQPDPGEGSEFHALREFQPGMDLRTIDWKQSARHGQLVAKEYRSERNHPVMVVIDSGRLMSEPLDGAPKIDRAINVALRLAWIGLNAGDRVGLAAFDARARVIGRPAAGTRAFAALRRLAAGIDYSSEETNFTLGLTAVAAVLDRRALVVIFTDFADPTSAQLMLESAAHLARRHLVLFVLFADEELEAIVAREPEAPGDVARAVVADGLMRERDLVVARLRRLGAEVVEAPADRVGGALIDRYLSLKTRGRL